MQRRQLSVDGRIGGYTGTGMRDDPVNIPTSPLADPGFHFGSGHDSKKSKLTSQKFR